jgi:hypothetical protein
MKNQRYLLISLLLLLIQNSLIGQITTLSVNGTGVKAELSGTPEHPLYPPDPDPLPDGYNPPAYSIFWIYPDGNFNFQDFAPGSNSLDNNNPTIGAGVNTIYSFLTEKYINSEPPEDAILEKIHVISNAIAPTDSEDMEWHLNLFYNNDPRPEYKMAVAMSYDNTIQPNHLYLFYNKVHNQAYPLFDNSKTTTIFPSYYHNSVTPRTTADFNISADPWSKYKNLINYPLATVDSKELPGGKRCRIFPVLTVYDTLHKPDDRENYPFGRNSHMLGILTSRNPISLSALEKGLAAFSLGLSPDPGTDHIRLQPLSGDTLFLAGIDTLRRPIVKSHDPNTLTLHSICYTGCRLNLEYELQICNDFDALEDEIDVELSGLHNFVIDQVVINHPLRGGRPTVFSSEVNSWTFYPVLSLPASRNRVPNCGNIKFTVIGHYTDISRDAAAVSRRIVEILTKLEDKRFIKCCVTFNNTDEIFPECNSILDYTRAFNGFSLKYSVPECPYLSREVHVLDICIPIWSLILVLFPLLFIVWYFRRRKFKFI